MKMHKNVKTSVVSHFNNLGASPAPFSQVVPTPSLPQSGHMTCARGAKMAFAKIVIFLGCVDKCTSLL